MVMIQAMFILLFFVGNVLATTFEIRTVNIPPYGTYNSQTDLSGGYYIELVNAIFEEAKLDYNNRTSPYARIINEIKSGKIDLALIMDRPDLASNSTRSFFIGTMNIVGLSNATNPISGIEDLDHKLIGQLRGGKYLPDSVYKNSGTFIYVDSYEQLVKMLLLKRVVLVIGVQETLFHYIEFAGIDPKKFAPSWLLETRKVRFLLNSKYKNTDLEQKLESAYRHLSTSGEVTRIMCKFYKC